MYSEKIQQPWDGRNRPWGCYKQASSTVTVSGCGDGENQKFARGKGCKSLIGSISPTVQYARDVSLNSVSVGWGAMS
eukprot:scaffold3320_cov64-Cyclotella_meneghiniana.AAC.4